MMSDQFGKPARFLPAAALTWLMLWPLCISAAEIQPESPADVIATASDEDSRSGEEQDSSSLTEATAAPVVAEDVEGPEWEPDATAHDWIQLTSGEWLKGEFKSMYNESVEFDSDKLDLLTIDWADVNYLKTHRDGQVNLEGMKPITGRLKITGTTITITRNAYSQIFNRDQLVSLTPSGDRELDLWSVKFTLGLNLRAGNTDQLDYTSKFNARRRTAKTRMMLDYIGNISRTGNSEGLFVETVNNHRITGSHNVYATRDFFYTPASFQYYRDPFQNISQRIIIGVGVGYTIINDHDIEWTVGGGPAYINTRYFTVQAGEDVEVGSAAIALMTTFDYALTSTIDFFFKYEPQLSSSETGGYTHHLETTIENEITGRLDFDVSLYWDRITHPAADEQGVSPEPDDYRLVLGLSWEY